MEMDGMNGTYEVVLFGPAGRKTFPASRVAAR
jgi:hypothetical protein